jgi:hypothetical protein
VQIAGAISRVYLRVACWNVCFALAGHERTLTTLTRSISTRTASEMGDAGQDYLRLQYMGQGWAELRLIGPLGASPVQGTPH